MNKQERNWLHNRLKNALETVGISLQEHMIIAGMNISVTGRRGIWGRRIVDRIYYHTVV